MKIHVVTHPNQIRIDQQTFKDAKNRLEAAIHQGTPESPRFWWQMKFAFMNSTRLLLISIVPQLEESFIHRAVLPLLDGCQFLFMIACLVECMIFWLIEWRFVERIDPGLVVSTRFLCTGTAVTSESSMLEVDRRGYIRPQDLATVIQGSHCLESIVLQWMVLKGNIAPVVDALASCASLKVLEVSRNCDVVIRPQDMTTTIQGNSCLESIVLESLHLPGINGFSDGTVALFEAAANILTLKKLRLSYPKSMLWGDPVVKAIENLIAKSKSLKVIDVVGFGEANSLVGVATALGKNTSLQELRLGDYYSWQWENDLKAFLEAVKIRPNLTKLCVGRMIAEEDEILPIHQTLLTEDNRALLKELRFYLKLNQVGRGRLEGSDPAGWESSEEWGKAILAGKDDPSVMFYFLQQMPSLHQPNLS